MFSCPGFSKSHSPPGAYFAGFALHLTYRQAKIKRVENAKRPKPSQVSSPNVPAAAPAKQAERNLIVYTCEPLYWTFGGYRSWAASFGLEVDMVADEW